MDKKEKIRLESHFGFTRTPFTKYMWARKMFESDSQRELIDGMRCWLEVHGLCVVTGPYGVGKSICLRRLRAELDEKRYEVLYLWNLRTSALGFLRSLARALGLAPSFQVTDMFDAISAHLCAFEKQTGRHPLLILDDAHAMSHELLELVRRLMNFEMDSEDRASVVLCGSEALASSLQAPVNADLRAVAGFAHTLRGFRYTDTEKYVAFHIERAEGPKDLFDKEAVRLLFNLSKGVPRLINQLALHSLIRAAVSRTERINAAFIKNNVQGHALLDVVEES
jgi:type II secretory pathway predicted ATPase ExeA